MNNYITVSLSICPFSIPQSYPAPIHTAAVKHTALDIANDLGDQRVIAILKSNGAKAEHKSLVSIGITSLIEISTFIITLFTLFKQKNN